VVIASLFALYVAPGSSHAGQPGPPSASIGDSLNRPVPPDIGNLPLVDQQGRPTTLDQFKGKAVFLVPFLTSCQEECPITTGALLVMQQALVANHLSGKVAIVEITVDPGRDSPDRMEAFAHMTGSTWPLLTGSSTTLASLWHYFGIYYEKVPEGSPPGINWQTNQPYTYDVDHSDGFVLLDAQLHERFIAGGMTDFRDIPADLRKLLDSQGESDLRNPGGGTWTVSDALNSIGWVLGRPIAH